jgi:hemerythrin HHE cation binding domain-containing protein
MRTDDESRCYINHLVAQHRRLHMMLRQMRNAILECVQPDETPSFAEIARILARLRQELEHHFAEEEAGGCLDEAVSCCPSLSVEAKKIQGDHALILEQIDSLIEHAETLPPTPQNQFAIQREFDRLYHKLQAHEAAENRLLAQGFGKPVNDDETDQSTLIYDM